MNILLTNDDGIGAKGLNILYDVLQESYNVYVFAPKEEKSACSNAINIRKKILIERIEEFKYAIDGYTADCVNIAINGNLIPPVDLIISGINHGPNLGDDIYFSGTVAGARTGYIFGKNAIAISVDCYDESDYFYDASNFLLNYIKDNLNFFLKNKIFLNINYPDLPSNEIKGLKYTTLGKRYYIDSYKRHEEGKNYYIMELDGIIENDDKKNTDVVELRNGYIAITPLTIDSTDYKLFNELIKNFNLD